MIPSPNRANCFHFSVLPSIFCPYAYILFSSSKYHLNIILFFTFFTFTFFKLFMCCCLLFIDHFTVVSYMDWIGQKSSFGFKTRMNFLVNPVLSKESDTSYFEENRCCYKFRNPFALDFTCFFNSTTIYCMYYPDLE